MLAHRWWVLLSRVLCERNVAHRLVRVRVGVRVRVRDGVKGEGWG